MQKVKKILKYSLISLGAVVVLAIVSSVLIVAIYEKEIKEYIVGSVNKNLRTEIKVDQIQFSVFKKFPDASLEFTNVLIKSVKDIRKSDFPGMNSDTLLAAKKLFLQFNIIDIFSKHYRIKKVHLDKGRIYLLANAKGRDNYHFWNSSNTTDTSSFQLKLKKISFTDVQIVYVDKALDISIKAHAKKFAIKGDLSSANYTLLTSGEVFLDKFISGDANFIRSENVALDLQLNVHNNEFSFEKSTLSVADFVLDVSGKVKLDKKNFIDVFVKGKDIDVQSFLSVLPEKYSQFKKEYSSDGNFYFETHISGTLDSANFVHIDSKFGVKNGSVSKENADIKLTGIAIDGTYSNGTANASATSFLKVKNFTTNIGNSQISGVFELENFNNLHVNFDANADINLTEAQNFFKYDTIKEISGNLKGNFKFSGNIKNPDKLTTDDFRNSASSGTLFLEKVNILLKNQNDPYTAINGIFNFDNNDAEIRTLQFKFQDSDFSINGKLKNLLCYLMVPDQKYEIDGKVSCTKLDVGHLLQSNATNGKKSEKINFPSDAKFNVSLDVKEFVFDKFNAKNVSGNISYSDKILSIENIVFNTLQGSISGSGTIQQDKEDNLLAKVKTKLQKIDIKQIFTVFNNFGQDFITDHHLKGIVTAEVNLSSEWKSDLTCNLDKIVVVSNILITNGELNDFKPLNELAGFIDLNDLKTIHFSDLKNDILIKDQKITIPQMDIHSSALDLSISGEQTFDSKIDYRFKILLSDLLFKKLLKNKKHNNEFGEIEDDGLGKTNIYLVMSGTTDNFKIRYDTKKVKETIKESVKEEKTNLKNILNEEFGFFKKDSAMIVAKKKKEEEEKAKKKKKIKIQWDENSEGEKDKSDEK